MRSVDFVSATSKGTAQCPNPSAWWLSLRFCESTALCFPPLDLSWLAKGVTSQDGCYKLADDSAPILGDIRKCGDGIYLSPSLKINKWERDAKSCILGRIFQKELSSPKCLDSALTGT